MIIDFYTTIIDNYWDAWFSFNLAKSLLKEYKSLEIRYFIDDESLFFKLNWNKKINRLNLFNLKDIKNIPPSNNIFNFFDRKIDFEFLHQFDFEINLINFSYFSLDKNIKNIHNTFYTSKNIKITHFVPSLLSDGWWVIINNKKKLSKTDFFKDKNDEFYNKTWVSVFCYKETFNEIKNEFKKYKDTIFFVFDNKTSWENIVNMPFLTMDNYLNFISICDKNIVRWENSLVWALVSNTPFLWDIYKENNNAHIHKLDDFEYFLNLKSSNFSDYNIILKEFNIWNKKSSLNSFLNLKIPKNIFKKLIENNLINNIKKYI